MAGPEDLEPNEDDELAVLYDDLVDEIIAAMKGGAYIDIPGGVVSFSKMDKDVPCKKWLIANDGYFSHSVNEKKKFSIQIPQQVLNDIVEAMEDEQQSRTNEFNLRTLKQYFKESKK